MFYRHFFFCLVLVFDFSLGVFYIFDKLGNICIIQIGGYMDSFCRSKSDDKLTIPRWVNFGLELELDKVDYDKVYSLVRQSCVGDWIVKRDRSLTEGMNAELVSPVLQNTKKTWIMLREMADLLKKLDADYSKCSFQVNFDGSMLPSMNDRVRFLKLWAFYEDILYRFSKGEDDEYRDSMDRFASPVILTLKGISYFSDQGIVDMFSDNKRYGVVFKSHDKDLIEFRTPNMTDNSWLWENYVTTFYYFLKFASSGKYDEVDLDRYIDRFFKSYVLENYEIERKEKALEFTKKVFPYKRDRDNFMRQYLGK